MFKIPKNFYRAGDYSNMVQRDVGSKQSIDFEKK